ncbi:MAG: substrate-binding domain-containing protein [Lachnospiraceae bacterium]|nr:substrate-binding domain-containing protein [Lachnospiraceae bacterium]
MEVKYRTLAETLRKEIAIRGPLGDQKLPTEAELAHTYGVSRQTVRQALSLLLREGMIVKRQGSGTFISPDVFPGALSSYNIAILLPDVAGYPSLNGIGDVEAALNEAGYSASVFSTENRAAREREILLNLLSRPVRGLLVRGVRTAFPNPNIPLYQELAARGTCIVFVGETYPELKNTAEADALAQNPSGSNRNPGLAFSQKEILQVSSDDFGGGELLTLHLTDLGHKKIAGIFRLDNQSSLNRYAGVLYALCEGGLSFDDRNFLWYDPLTARMPDSKMLLSFIRIQLIGCTAVICEDESIAAALIRELQKFSLSVPQRISVAAFASGSENHPMSGITSADRPDRNPWRIAAELLLANISGKPVSSVLCPWKLRAGESTAAINSDKSFSER